MSLFLFSAWLSCPSDNINVARFQNKPQPKKHSVNSLLHLVPATEQYFFFQPVPLDLIVLSISKIGWKLSVLYIYVFICHLRRSSDNLPPVMFLLRSFWKYLPYVRSTCCLILLACHAMLILWVWFAPKQFSCFNIFFMQTTIVCLSLILQALPATGLFSHRWKLYIWHH